jgi:aspartyl-tRNA(Asn)/glutamyl-tRNA(Gln) amidotransferase subunit A
MLPYRTIEEAGAALRRREVSPIDLVENCLGAIDRFESNVQAWVLVDRQGALDAAEKLERELQTGRDRGPLHGIPLGIKDIVDVAGMPTRAGSTLTSDQPAKHDAMVVARLRAAGAIILGKTVTTEFACFDPSPTRNPWNLAHTPGGSSSGSAAAVALETCLGAIGSQTGGSITRPATYCGIAGCKPTFGRTSRAGVTPVSFHLDHVGSIARTAADCGLILSAISGDDPADPACAPRPPLEYRADSQGASPRLGVIWPYFFAEDVDGETVTLARVVIERLKEQGATLVELALPEGWSEVHTMHRRIYFAEAAEVHQRMFGAPRTGYGPKMTELLAEGFAVSSADYQAALQHQVGFRHSMTRVLAEVDALITPATPGPAPASLESTGDPRFNAPWSYAGTPTVSIPFALTTSGLPIALQLIGAHWTEAKLLSTATWCEKRLEFASRPRIVANAT